jgi:hypothetical protein
MQGLLMIHKHDVYCYDIVFFYLAGAIVFCDEIFEWLSAKTGRTFRRQMVLLSQIIMISLLVAMALSLEHAQASPRLTWHEPVFLIVFWLVMRAVRAFVRDMFGFEDD